MDTNGSVTPHTAQVLVDRGHKALRADQRRRARHYFTTAVASDPTCVAAWRGLAELAADPRTALEYLQQAQAHAPDDARLLREIEELQAQVQYADRARPPRPRRTLTPARLEAYPSRWRWIIAGLILLALLALIVVGCLNLAPVISAQGIPSRSSPGLAAEPAHAEPSAPHAASPATWLRMSLTTAGRAALAAEDWPRALALLEAARRLEPNDPATTAALYQATLDRGYWHATNGRYVAAIHRFDQAQALAPDNLDPARALRQARHAMLREKGPAAQQKLAPTAAPAIAAPATSLTGRWIDINLSRQTLTAYQGSTPVLQALVSTGTSRYPTPTGRFAIQRKYRSTHMSGPGYSLPNVPYAMFFVGGYAIHGTYWHSNFGTPMSHGCVNMRTDQAGWLFDWAAVGTPVVIHY